MSFDEGFVLGLALGAKKSKSAESVADPDLAIWETLPEPEDNQTVFLLRATETEKNAFVRIDVYTTGDAEIDTGNFTIDWGDGTTEVFEPYDVGSEPRKEHTYAAVGDYIVTCTSENMEVYRMWRTWRYGNYAKLIMMKYGNNVRPESERSSSPLSSIDTLKYLKLSENTDFDNTSSWFNTMVSLRKVECGKSIVLTKVSDEMFRLCYNLDFSNWDFSNVTEIGTYAFYQSGIKNISFPLCIRVGSNAFYYCYQLDSIYMPVCQVINGSAFSTCFFLKQVNLPKCISVGGNAFANCCSLIKADFAEGCTFGTDAFYHCFSLYPIPS